MFMNDDRMTRWIFIVGPEGMRERVLAVIFMINYGIKKRFRKHFAIICNNFLFTYQDSAILVSNKSQLGL